MLYWTRTVFLTTIPLLTSSFKQISEVSLTCLLTFQLKYHPVPALTCLEMCLRNKQHMSKKSVALNATETVQTPLKYLHKTHKNNVSSMHQVSTLLLTSLQLLQKDLSQSFPLWHHKHSQVPSHMVLTFAVMPEIINSPGSDLNILFLCQIKIKAK